MRIALKVDCDTALGTRDGVPRLLRLFGKHGIRATFFFSFGPDRSGRAAFRVFSRRGFLKKMLRSRAPSLYPLRTMLSGTLLPAPVIGRFAGEQMRSAAAGHEVGVHAWDHVAWHDGAAGWSRERVADHYGRSMGAYSEIFSRPAVSSACAGWTVSEAYLSVREGYPLLYTSDTRGGSPFLPEVAGAASRIPEIPSTLPTLDEMLGNPRFPTPESLRDFFANAPPEDEVTVHTIHTEVEGSAYSDWFDRLLGAWRDRGARFIPLEDRAREIAADPGLPIRRIRPVTIPGRGGTVASGLESSSPRP